MQRRVFLRYGLYAGILAVGAGAGLSLYPSKIAYQPRGPLHVLEPREFAILATAAERVIQLPDCDPVAIAHDLDTRLVCMPREAQKDFQKLLGTLDNGLLGLILDGRPRPFTRLKPIDQVTALEAFRDSRLLERRVGYLALRKLCFGSYYARDTSWAAIGYPGPPSLSLPEDYQQPANVPAKVPG